MIDLNITYSCKDYVELQKRELADVVSKMKKKPVLHVVQDGDEQASNAYIRGKKKDCEEVGIAFKLHKFDDGLDTQMLCDLIDIFNVRDEPYIVQLPVGDNIDMERVVNRYNPRLDVDGFLYNSKHKPCTPRGIMDWIAANGISLEGKNVCILGRSDIVGKPLAQMMTDANATVTLCHSRTSGVDKMLAMGASDIIVSAIGKNGATWVPWHSSGKLVIDVGINRDCDGKLCGDVDWKYSEYPIENDTRYITPVPGGVGLLTRVALLKNVVDCYNK